MKWDKSLKVSPEMTEVMLIVRCCSKKNIKKNAESAIAILRAIEDDNRPDLLMFDFIEAFT